MLESARAPQRWRRGTAAASSRLRTLAIRSAWLARFLQPAPQLLERPLFGDALADAVALLGAVRRDAEENAPRRRVAPTDRPHANARQAESTPFSNGVVPRGPTLTPVPRRTRGANAVSESKTSAAYSPSDTTTEARGAANGASAASTAAPLALPRAAPELLLERLLRTESPREASAHTARTERSAGMAARVHPAHLAPQFAALSPISTSLRDPKRTASWRSPGPVSPALAAAPVATASLRARILHRAHGLRADARPRADLGAEPAIERDWQRSPLGPTAPPVLLERLASSRGIVSPAPSAGRSRSAPLATSRVRDAARSLTANASVESTAPAAPEPPSAVAAPVGGAPAFTQPEETLPLPPFAWPRSFAEPELAAAAAASSAARVPAQARDDEDDLDRLSAKIERILVEQARRNGIDV
jgi:hypothetical protein